MSANKILHLFLPKEDRFFTMLKLQAENVLKGGHLFKKLVDDYDILSIEELNKRVLEIRRIENKGDNIAHDIFDSLHKSFITPLDKEDIHQMALLLDDVVDLIDAVTKRFLLFNIRKTDRYIKEMTNIIWKSVKEIEMSVSNLNKLELTKEHCIQLHALENESDSVYYKAISHLFHNHKDPVDIIKYKEIYDIIEDVNDKAEDVAIVIQGIVVKHE
jgi:hypothetical protein